MKKIFILLFITVSALSLSAQTHHIVVYCRVKFYEKNPVDYLMLPKLLPDSLKEKILIDYSKYKFRFGKNEEDLFVRLSLNGWKMISFEKYADRAYLFEKEISLDEDANQIFNKKLDLSDKK